MKRILFICAALCCMELQSQELVNGNFEQWKDSSGTAWPVGWTPSIFDALYHSPSRVAYRDSFSLVLSTWYSYVEGYLFYGEHKRPYYRDWTKYTVPVNEWPLQLTGYYRYMEPIHPADRAEVKMILKSVSGDTLSYGQLFLDTSTHWKRFNLTLLQKNYGMPAAMAILFSSREGSSGMNDDNYPNRLYLDDLRLSFRKE